MSEVVLFRFHACIPFALFCCYVLTLILSHLIFTLLFYT